MITTMILMAAIIVLAPAILVCIRNWKIVWAGVIVTGCSLAYLITTLPTYNQK